MARPRHTLRQRSPDPPDTPVSTASPAAYRLMRQADPDIVESIVRTFLVRQAESRDLRISFHAQALLAALYRTTYPMLLERVSVRCQSLIEALRKK